MSDRPTFDDIQREQEKFIGPPEPAQSPKMARALTESDEVNADTLVTLLIIREALRAGLLVDPKHLPERIVEILKENCAGPNMPVTLYPTTSRGALEKHFISAALWGRR